MVFQHCPFSINLSAILYFCFSRKVIMIGEAGLVAWIKGHLKGRLFKNFLQNIETEILLESSFNAPLVFSIVHWNAPDFLSLNVNQIQLLHPESKIYVLDNGSLKDNLNAVKKELAQFDNVTLIAVKSERQTVINKLFPRVTARLRHWFTHTLALQFLLNYSSKQSDNITVFLDQDCILCNRIDRLVNMLDENTLLVGARDYVVIPRDFGPLKQGKLRNAHDFVHASFMILQPKRISQMFGDYSFFHPIVTREPYHGISIKAAGKILFLETKMHDTIPFLTSYSYKGVTYAWHAWYSSRVAKLSTQELLDGLPVSWLREVRRLAYEYMKKVHNDTLAKHSENVSRQHSNRGTSFMLNY